MFSSYPLRKNPSDPENHYHRAYKIGIQHKNILNCKQLYSCKFSLLELALGLYSQSPILPSWLLSLSEFASTKTI